MSTDKQRATKAKSGAERTSATRSTIPLARKLLYAALAAVLILGLLLGAGEGLLRLFGVGYETAFFVPADEHHVTSNPRFPWRYFGRAMQPRTTNIVHLPQKKPPNTYRIFVLGGSAAMGVPSPDFSFSRFLEVMLKRAYPDQKFEVVNTALTAINSHVVRDIAPECAEYDPDLFIVYLGNNEVVGPFGPASVFEALADNLWAIRASLWLKGTRLGQWVGELADTPTEAGDWEGMQMFLNNRVASDDGRLERVYRQFAANLTAICRAGERVAAKVLLCSVAVNLKDCPPFASSGSGSGEEQGETQRLAEQIATGDGGKTKEYATRWIAPLQERLAAEPENALLHYLLGRCQLAAGKTELATESLASARDLDLLRFRADARINEIIRSVAGAETGRGVHLVDVERAFNEDSATGIAGGDYFFEHVHFNFRGQYELARTLFAALCEQLPTEIQPKNSSLPQAASFEVCAEALALTALEQRGVLNATLALVDKPPFLDQLGHRNWVAEQQAEVARLEKVLATDSSALQAAYLTAVQQDPNDLILRRLAGRFLLANDQIERSLIQFETLAAALPEDHQPLVMLGQGYYEQGRYREAAGSFEKACALTPDPADTLSEVAAVYLRAGELSQALAFAERAHRLRPERISTTKLLARIHLASEHLAHAYRLLRQVYALRPDDPEVLEQLAILSLQKNDNKQAAEYAREYLKGRPDTPRLQNLYAASLRNLGRLEEAAAEYEKILAILKNNPNVLKQYVQVLRSLGRDADAAAYCQQHLESEGGLAVLLEQLALLRATSRDPAVYDPEQALALARSLNRLSTTADAQSLNTLAIAQAETGDFSAAKQTVRQALALARQADNERAIGLLTRQLRLIDDRRKPSEGLR